ncbi:MAG: Appr-1-p processing protein [Spiribacter salinus]|uniref:Appr-1-p processing protein n=1 Tax=Spiribacter salinus TaxID=1335746 RepID=A0A540VPB5_9GAMM|nr:MAG: Appr-1-p processing protein [Spiribacter salinus]
MITPASGDILKAQAEALVNTVNCVGVMGRGIALQFKKAYPENFKEYQQVCKAGRLVPGMMLIHDRGTFTNPRYIINFPTKKHWRGRSAIGDIESGLGALVREIRERGITSIAIPPLGCGLGGLSWEQVRPVIETAFEQLPDVQVLLYEPAGAPKPEAMVKESKAPNLTVGRAALVALMHRYLAAVMDPFVSLLEVHKLMYFLQEMGEPLKLKYIKALYGPYAGNLRHVLSRIEGHLITGYADGEDDPEKPLEIKPEALEPAETFLADHPQTQARFDRVARLIEGFETPYGMELLATVHWVATREGASSAEAAVAKTHAWNQRKQQMFPADHIRRAWTALQERGALA